MANDREETGSTSNIPDNLEIPVLAIRNTVIFPVLAFPINVGRERSVRAVEEALATEHKYLGIFAQRDPKTVESSDVYQTEPSSRSSRWSRSGNKLNVIIQGLSRARVQNWTNEDELLRAQVETFVEPEATEEAEDLMGSFMSLRKRSSTSLHKSSPRRAWSAPLMSRACWPISLRPI